MENNIGKWKIKMSEINKTVSIIHS